MDIRKMEQRIDYYNLKKGRQYYKNGAIKKISFNQESNTFMATVNGEYSYMLSLRIQKGILKEHYCTCPVNGLCKHQIAILYAINNNLDLQEAAGIDVTHPQENDIAFERLYLQTVKRAKAFENNLEIKLFADSFLFSNLKVHSAKNYCNQAVLLFDKLYGQIPNSALAQFILSFIEGYYRRFLYIDPLIESIAKVTETRVKKYYFEVLSYLDLDLFVDEQQFDAVAAGFVNALLKFGQYQKILGVQNPNLKIKIFNYITNNKAITTPLDLVVDYITAKTEESFLKLKKELPVHMLKMFVYEIKGRIRNIDEAIFYLVNAQIKIEYDLIELSFPIEDELLVKLLKYDRSSFLEHVESLTVSFVDNRISVKQLFNYLDTLKQCNYDLSNIFNYYPTIYFEAVKGGFVSDSNVMVIENGGFPTKMRENYFNAVNMPFVTLDKPKKLKIIISADPTSDFDNFIILEESKYSKNFDEYKGSISENEVFIENEYYNRRLVDEALKIKSNNKIDDNYQRITNAVITEREANLRIQNQEATIKWIDNLSLALLKKPQPKLELKAQIRLIFDFDNLKFKDKVAYSDDYISIALKVGTDKFYFIKKGEQFLIDIEANKFIEYGKRLAFNHHIDSFTDRSKQYINILEKHVNIGRVKNNDAFIISQQKFQQLFNHCHNDIVILYSAITDYQEYLVLSDNFQVEIELLPTSFIINLEEKLNRGRFIVFSDFDIILDDISKTIQKVIYSSDKQRILTHYLLKQKNLAIDFGMEQLAKKVVPLLQEEIKINEQVQEKIAKNKITIETKLDFDCDKDIIIAESKYLIGNMQINEKELGQYQIFVNNYLSVLASFGFNEDNQIIDQTSILHFLRADLSELRALSKVFVSTNLANKKVVSKISTTVSVTSDEGMLKTHIAASNLDSEQLKKVLEGYRIGKKYVLLGNDVIQTDSSDVVDLVRYMEYNELNVKDLNKDYRKPIYELFKLDYKQSSITFDIQQQLKDIMDEIIDYSRYDVVDPPGTYSLLKPYQQEGFKWFKSLAKHNVGGILADDMGLGKTLQTISFLESEDFKISMVVCPKSLIFNWANEIEKFNASFEYIIYLGNKEVRKDIFDQISQDNQKKLVIISYDTLRSDIELFEKLKFDIVILDEAQHIKTVTAQKTVAAKRLVSDKRFILTGTPIENSIFDLWSMFDFLMPGYLYKYGKFRRIGEKANQADEETLDLLIKKTRPFILRRTKGGVLKELPDKIEEVLYATFDGQNKKVYDAYLSKVKDKLGNPEVGKLDLLKDLTRLRQLCISPQLVYENYQEEQIKIDVVVDLINEAINSGHKVLVFSSFVKALEILVKPFGEEKYYMLTGDTPAYERMEMATSFNQPDSQQKIFFISLKAGGTGLNLTGADIVIHLDPWWNVAAENQASDRAHRIGQKQVVTVYKVVMKGSIEEKIILLQNKKKDLFDKMIENNGSAKLTDDDYRFILGADDDVY